jgi:hypothetical protein
MGGCGGTDSPRSTEKAGVACLGSGSRLGELLRLLEDTFHGIGRLRALGNPECGAIKVELEILPCFGGTIAADLLDEASIAGAAFISHHHAEMRIIQTACSF